MESTPITAGGTRTERDVRELVDAAADFRLTRERAISIVSRVADAVDHWANAAQRAGVATDAIDSMKPSFTGPNRERARSL